MNIDVKLNDKTDTLEIENDFHEPKNILITDIDNYSFLSLINNIMTKYNGENLELIKNMALKPYNYKKKLFVSQKKDIWQNLLKVIFKSKTFSQVINILYGEKLINIFKIDSIIEKIFDNIRFFIYNTYYHGLTHDFSLRI